MKNCEDVKLMQWNTLSRDEFFCNKKSFPKVNESYLNWSHREDLFKKIIKQVDPDLLCLQEVDDYDEFKNSIISDSKYSSEYFRKNQGVQGIALFYNNLKFNLLKFDKVTLPKDDTDEESNQFFMYGFFENKLTNDHFCLISTHLKAKIEFSNVRYYQIKAIIDFIEKSSELFKTYNCLGVIICGDFNAEPDEKCINYIQNYQFKTNQLFLNTKLTSAYNFSNVELDNHIEMTTFKFRDKEYYRVIDYIFHSEAIKINKTSPTMKKSEIKFLTDENNNVYETGLPSLSFPSDHYYLSVNFSFN